jgi:diguanylate cyclase (GGDEF)-like protein/PAS domain S-box-containing protein
VVTAADARLPEETLEDLYDHAPCGYLSTTPDGVVVKVNETFLEWTGHCREDVLGRRFRDLLTPGGRMYHETHVAPLLRLRGSVKAVALELLCADDRRLPVLVSSELRTDGSGNPGLVRTAIVDQTDRSTYQRELVRARRAAEESEGRIRVLHRAAAEFAAATGTSEILAALTAVLSDQPGAAGAGVWLLDADRGVLVHDRADDPAPATLASPVVPTAGALPLAAAVRGRDVVVLTRDGAERALEDAMRDAGIESLLAVPLLADGEVIGAYQIGFRHAADLPPEQLELHRTLARQATAAVERTRLDEEVRHLARHDPLTGAANRAQFADRLDLAVADARRTGRPVAAMFLDLDGFKAVNDGLGHRRGDELLVEITRRLRRVVRPGDTVGRLGGDEFAVLCPGADPAEAGSIAGRLGEVVREPLTLDGRTVAVTASVGIVVYGPDSCPAAASAGQLLQDADAAMYRAKLLGKDRHVMYDATLDAEFTRRSEIEALLRTALDGDGVVVHFQPIVDLPHRTVTGVEALCRLDPGDGRLLAPDEFIHVAEERGLVAALGRRVLEFACAQLVAWDADGAPELTLAVNVAADQAGEADFADDVLGILAGTGFPPERLVVELTESALLAASPATVSGLRRLRAEGVGIALDDFGTRYASLRYVQQFPLTALKVDRSFVAALPGGHVERAIVRSVAQLAADLGVSCTAEGIETDAQLEFLTELGVHGQGYLLARPMDATACRDLLRTAALP